MSDRGHLWSPLLTLSYFILSIEKKNLCFLKPFIFTICDDYWLTVCWHDCSARPRVCHCHVVHFFKLQCSNNHSQFAFRKICKLLNFALHECGFQKWLLESIQRKVTKIPQALSRKPNSLCRFSNNASLVLKITPSRNLIHWHQWYNLKTFQIKDLPMDTSLNYHVMQPLLRQQCGIHYQKTVNAFKNKLDSWLRTNQSMFIKIIIPTYLKTIPTLRHRHNTPVTVALSI